MFTASPCEKVLSLNTAHSPFLSAPDDLVRELLVLVNPAGKRSNLTKSCPKFCPEQNVFGTGENSCFVTLRAVCNPGESNDTFLPYHLGEPYKFSVNWYTSNMSDTPARERVLTLSSGLRSQSVISVCPREQIGNGATVSSSA